MYYSEILFKGEEYENGMTTVVSQFVLGESVSVGLPIVADPE